jgi:hypothetical protein
MEDEEKPELLAFLTRLILQLSDPCSIARNILPYIAIHTESENFMLQREALRFRLVARC